ncbi:MAG: NAD(P)/FAD-dependent oxidoreductase [Clostridiales bacterium]|jgi:2,4-dienoyl-CoA reductase-like NADH-dependent reductase (Old Yellow Enzyme family)/thioredoxin reductase|nr:NAD(P)/FAD-dependent oxidoreductase [Eubacteriales bacterium]MDH7565633.1 NAD(P)/FAD-dependent oxidoreductase [Clostridiales bacterium]
MSFSTLLSPIRVSAIEIKNRFVVPAMGTSLPNPDGTVSQRLVDYWEARAKGGFGLLIVEFSHVDPLGQAIPSQLGVWKDDFIPGLKKLTETVHKYNTKTFLQLHHAGRETNHFVTGNQPVAPSPIPCPVNRELPRELTTKEVYDLIEKFGDAALRAKIAGFDGVEIHAAHGYLVAQFISSYTNKRTDEFGGSFSGRMKFAVELIKNIRSKAGNNFPISFRISGDEHVPGGRTIAESRLVAKVLEEAGANAIHVSTGVYASLHWTIAPAAVAPGYNAGAAAEIKKAVNIPVIAVGRINDPFLAEDIVASGMADMVALGRESLADPEFPNKVALGRIDEISPCIACMQRCQGAGVDAEDTGVSCLVNPFTGKEGILKMDRTNQPKKILIVGAGPAGLEAAWVAAMRGHSVTVYEKLDAPGGQYRTGAIPPFKQDISRAINYYMTMGRKYGVEYKFGTEANAELIEKEKPDAVILATGGVPLIPKIQGIDSPKVVNAVDVIEGKVYVGEKVLIIGGGLVGVETADLLGEHGHKVTIVEMLPQIAGDENPTTKYYLLDRLKNYGVEMLTGFKVKAVLDDGVLCEKDGIEQKLEGYDSIVLAIGSVAYNPLEDKIKDKVAEVHVIGDAVKARKALEAISEGARLAVRI